MINRLIVLALLQGTALLSSCSGHHRQAAGQASAHAVPVQVATAKKGDIGVYLDALGTVTPVNTVSVISRVQGQIVFVHYAEGQQVKKGDPLVDIDPRPFRAALTQAEGQLAHDAAVLEEARIDLARYRRANARNAIPRQQLDDQIETVLQDQGTVKTDEGTLENARVNLAYCHIQTPIDGTVGLRLIDPGNVVQANSTVALAVITQLDPITVIFNIAEDSLPQVLARAREGKRMEVAVFDRAQEKKLATGVFLASDNQIDPTTGTVRIRAIFDNRDAALFPNQFVNAKLLTETLTGATLISSAAVQRGPEGAFVYVIESGKTAKMRPVEVKATEEDTVAVEGIDPGEVVAVSGFDKLEDGAHITIQAGQTVALSERDARP